MTHSKPQQLALLIAAPQDGESAMHNDMTAMTDALRGWGMPVDHILTLHGRLDRDLVLACLHTVRRHIAGWSGGSLFLHISGHGFFEGERAETARPGLLFADTGDVTDEYHLFWDDFFNALDLPHAVHLTLLPDL